jgi:hypothetical protein
MPEATFVFRHADEAEARRFCKELFDLYPFCGPGPTCVIACSTGDAMSVSDAVRMALECTAIDPSEQREFALEMAECNNWEDCMTLAAKWELRHEHGEFLDARKASEQAA